VAGAAALRLADAAESRRQHRRQRHGWIGEGETGNHYIYDCLRPRSYGGTIVAPWMLGKMLVISVAFPIGAAPGSIEDGRQLVRWIWMKQIKI
jgi:hypothetical protein